MSLRPLNFSHRNIFQELVCNGLALSFTLKILFIHINPDQMILLDSGAVISEEPFNGGTNYVMSLPISMEQTPDQKLEITSFSETISVILHVNNDGTYKIVVETSADELVIKEHYPDRITDCIETLKAYIAQKFHQIMDV